jgi:outer membrane protein assembly factor BamB
VFSVADGVTALDAETGEEEWAADLPESVDHTPVLADDRLIVAAGDRLVAFESTDGSERWSTRLPRPVGDALTAGDSMVTVPLAGRIERPGIVAYATGDGEQLWTAPTVGARTAALDGDAVYVSGYRQDGDTGILRSLATDDGSIDWEVELDHPDTGPVVADGSVVLGDDGGLGVHDPDTGERVRTLGPFGDRLPEPPAVAGGTAFLGSTDPAIVAVSIDDGSIEWTREGSVAARISAGRETVVVAAETLPEASAAGIAGLERSTGDVRWQHELEGFDVFPSTPPALADGAVFFCSNDSSGIVALGDLAPAEDG